MVSIERQAPTDEDTNADSLTFRVTFSEPVENVEPNDFAVTAPGDGVRRWRHHRDRRHEEQLHRRLGRHQLHGDGDADGNAGITVAVAAGVADDRAGNASLAAASDLTVDYVVGWTTPCRRCSRSSATTGRARRPSTPTPTALTFRVTFSEDAANVNAADFDASGTTGDATGVADVTGNAAQYIVTVSSGDLDDYDGAVGLTLASDHDIADKAGNALTNTTPSGANQSYTVDNTAPT